MTWGVFRPVDSTSKLPIHLDGIIISDYGPGSSFRPRVSVHTLTGHSVLQVSRICGLWRGSIEDLRVGALVCDRYRMLLHRA